MRAGVGHRAVAQIVNEIFQFGTGERWAIVSAFAYAAVGVMLRAAAPTA